VNRETKEERTVKEKGFYLKEKERFNDPSGSIYIGLLTLLSVFI